MDDSNYEYTKTDTHDFKFSSKTFGELAVILHSENGLILGGICAKGEGVLNVYRIFELNSIITIDLISKIIKIELTNSEDNSIKSVKFTESKPTNRGRYFSPSKEKVLKFKNRKFGNIKNFDENRKSFCNLIVEIIKLTE